MEDNQPRRVPRRNLRSRLLYSLAALCLLSVAAWALTEISEKLIDARQEALIERLKSNFADSPDALVKQLCRAQTEFIIITAPGMTRLHQPYGMMSFDPKSFPAEFLKGLVYDVESGCPVYTITVQENPKTREIHIYNGNDEPILTLARDGYDPLWLVKLLRPDTYDSKYTKDFQARREAWLDPSRVEIELKLLPVDYIDLYAENSIASAIDAVASLRSASPTGGMMMRSMLAPSNIVFDAISKVSTGMCLVVSYPDDFTNRLEMFVSSNLLDFGWSLLATNLVTAGTNTLTWVDTSATNGTVSNRFYAAGNADLDSDGDGIADGREILMYRTDPANKDSDGDGLVDGYSGVVTTNAYPGGIATNGTLYVEGELSWFTNPKVKDTDGDGMDDGWEVAHGHNPLDPNDPPNVSGTVFYSGRQTGTVWVIAVTSSNSWSTSHCSTSSPASSPNVFSYLIPDLEQTNYWVKAWMDSDLNGSTNATEARGILTNIAIIVTNRVTAQDFALADPDDDSDNLPDWWEIAYFGNATNNYANVDSDGDEYTNHEEYEANTDPTNNLSQPWNLSGAITYTGPQTGIIHVVACTNGTDWAWVHAETLTNPGAYTITHLPPNTDYWVRAWRDSNGDGQPTSWEAYGSQNSNPVFLDNNHTGQDIDLDDPDNDGDGIADWWEVLYGLDPTHGGNDGAAAWWKLDETNGTNVLDATANAHNGVLFNGEGNAWGTGVISNGLLLNGTNSYVEVPDSIGLKPNYISVGLWITPARLYTNGTARFLSKRVSGGTAGYSLGYESGALVFTVCSSGAKPLAYPCALTSGVPVHVAGTYNGTVQALYLNGAMVASTNYDWGMSGFGAIFQKTNELRLGATSGTLTNFFAGQLDDVRVYPGEWTTNQIYAIWELGADPDQDGLSNTEEYKHGTNPTNSDSDADGMLDGWEVKHGLNPLSAVDATEDKDGDGYLNVYEAKWAADPNSTNSYPSPTFIVTNGISTIQGAINSATQDYAIIKLLPATYSGTNNVNVDFLGKRLMVTGSGTNTIIDGQNLTLSRGFICRSGEGRATVLHNLFVRKMNATYGPISTGGGGIWCSNASPTIYNCSFNQCDAYGGGGMAFVANSSPMVRACRLWGNVGPYEGAAILVMGGEAQFRDCEITGNGTNVAGAGSGHTTLGGGIFVSGGNPTFSNCTLSANNATQGGGAYWSSETGSWLGGLVISNNTQGPFDAAGGMFLYGDITVSNTLIAFNSVNGAGVNPDQDTGEGGGLACYGNVRVFDSEVSSNSISRGRGAGVYLVSGTNSHPVIQGCAISGNSITTRGSGGGAAMSSSPWPGHPALASVIRGCSVVGNRVASDGGGLSADSLSVGAVESSYIGLNVSTNGLGGGVYTAGNIILQNCTVVSNQAGVGGGIYVGEGTNLTVRNTIIWNNATNQISITNGGSVALSYSCVQGGFAGGTAVITNNPRLFAGYRLSNQNSPCVDAGTTNGLPETDISGKPRLSGNAPDIGCDEFVMIDTDSDGMFDDWENWFFGSLSRDGTGDHDGDGVTEGQEYAQCTDPTSNVDTDRDSLSDDYEIHIGTDPGYWDSDGDGMFDGWEVARGLDPINPDDAGGDWNGDGIANSNDFQRSSLAIRVTMADPDRNDDTWNLILNNSVVASCNAGNTWYDSQVVNVERGTTVRFMLQRQETGQGGGTDEYQVNFEAADWPSNQAPWIASAGNAALSSNVAWNGSTPPDVSGIYWEFTIPTNMLQQDAKAGGDDALTKDPINTINGNITVDETDLAVACPVFGLAFVRAYNSAATASNTLGQGWTHSLDRSLATVSNAAYGSRAGTFKVMTTGDGQSYWFCTEADESFTLAPPQTANLALVFTNGEYRVTWPGGTVARFDASGAIQRLEDGFGIGLAFTHNAGKLTQVTHDNGKALTLSYTGDLLTRVDSPSTNLYVTLSYNADGLLTNAIRVADGVAKCTRYDYENVCHVMTQRVNAAGHVFAYSVGHVTNSPAWNGNPAVVTARGTGMTIDPSGLCWNSHTLSYTNPGGFATRVTYDRGDTNVVLEYAYDPVKMLITGITGPGTPGVAAWSNTWTHFQYDAAQNLTNESLKDGASGDTLEAVAAYDGRHNVLSNGMKYCGNATTNWFMYSWNADDTLASSTDPAGHKTAFEYTNGLISVVRECTNGASGFETRFGYTTNGLLVSVTNANGHGIGYENDAAGYVSRVVPALGPDARFLRNDLGQVTTVIVPGDASYRTNALTVNALGRITAVTHPDGLTECFAFDILGNLTNAVDTAGRTNVITWLPNGKPASVSRWLDGPNPTNVTIGFAYDRQFNTLEVTDPMGRTVESYKLDSQDRPVSVTNMQGQVMTINWGVGDYIKGRTRFDGTELTNLYGTDGRLSEVSLPGMTNRFTDYADGSLKTASNAVGVVSNGFNGANRLSFTTGAVPQSAISYGYYPAGQVSDVTTAAGITTYALDAADRLVGIAAPEGNFEFGYATNGLLGTMSYPGGVTLSNRFDVLDRATSLVWRTSGGSTSRSFAYSFNAAGMITNVSREDGGWSAYTYDSLDRLLTEKQYASTGLTYSASWNYDLAGTRTMAVNNGETNVYSYAAGNCLTNFGSGTLVQHDLAGNITNLQYSANRVLGLTWDAAYQLSQVSSNGVVLETYRHDALGRRVSVIAGTVTNNFIYSGPHIVAETSNNVLSRAYTYGPGVDNVLSMTTYGATTNTYYYIKDHLGSVHALVNTNGAVVEQYKYTAWGETTVLSSNGTMLTASAYGNRFAWQGREVSWGSGLYHFRARWYDPVTGRFLSNDPIGISGGLNQYVFCGNNPVNFRDPLGLCTEGGSLGRTGASIGVGFIPFVGSGQSIVELITGYDYIAGEQTSRGWAAVGIMAGLAPGGKGVLKGVVKGGEEVLSHENGIVKLLRRTGGKGNDVVVKTQREAEELIERARPEIPWRNTYESPKPRIGKEVHPSDGSGLDLPHIKWRDWSGGKGVGAEGHIYFEGL